MSDQQDPIIAEMYAQPMRERLIGVLEPLGFEFGVGVPTSDGHLQYLGFTRDRLESVQVVGESDALQRVIVLCRIPSPEMKQRGSFQGKLMIVVASLICPDWLALPEAIGSMIPRLVKKSPITLYGQRGRKITLSFTRKTGFIALKIEL